MHQYSSSHYQHSSYSSRPAPPPSPPVEDNSKCSLPSISTLLVFADGAQPHPNGSSLRAWRFDHPTTMCITDHHQTSDRQQSQPLRVNLPPTPPMRPDSVFEGGNSPIISSTSPTNYYYQGPPAHNNIHRNSYPPAQKPGCPSPPDFSYSTAKAYYGSQQQQHDIYSKHQLMVPVSVAPPSSLNPWHHHHHQSPASHAAFPQSQDRYICQTCNKAFSRPSSLRIHSHSHTGEKPFKCPHHGCGKAFSVRSNMKRHERGCHQ